MDGAYARKEAARRRLEKKLVGKVDTKTAVPCPTACDLDDRDWADAHRHTLVLLDRSAVVRLGGCVEMIDALYGSVTGTSVSDLPTWRISVPMYHGGIDISNQTHTLLSPKGVKYLEDGQLHPLGDKDTVCLSVRLWSHSATPQTAQCNVGDWRRGKSGLEIKVRDAKAKDPVTNATTWTHGADGELGYVVDHPQVTPVQASFLAALHTNEALFTTKPLEGEWCMAQPGVLLCRAGQLYPKCRGTPFERNVLALVYEAHAMGVGLFCEPNQAGLFRIYSRAWGRYSVEPEDPSKVVRRLQMKFFAMPYEAFVRFQEASLAVTQGMRKTEVPLGEVMLRLATEGFKEITPATVTVNCVATYCKYVSCKALFVRAPCGRIGCGWQTFALARANLEEYDCERWQECSRDLCSKLAALPADKLVYCNKDDPEAIDIDKCILLP